MPQPQPMQSPGRCLSTLISLLATVSTSLPVLVSASAALAQPTDAQTSLSQALPNPQAASLKERADQLLQQSVQQYQAGQFQAALSSAQQALPLYRQIGDRQGEGVALNNIGEVYRNLGQTGEALKYYQQALVIFQALEDKAGEGAVLNNIGEVYRRLGQTGEALKYYQQALAIFQALEDRTGEGRTLNRIGFAYYSLGQTGEALKYYQQALAIFQALEDKAGEGAVLNNIGEVYRRLGQYGGALKYYQQALAIFQALEDRAREGTTLNNIGAVYDSLGQYAEAMKVYQQALAIRKEVQDRAGEGTTLNNIGEVYRRLGQYGGALKYYQQALAIFQALEDKAGEGTTLNNIGLVSFSQGQYSEALKFLQQALAIVKALEDKAGEGQTLNNIGTVYLSRGQYAEAMKVYQQALAIRKEVQDKAGEGQTLNNIGGVYLRLGQYPEAERTLRAAVQAWESLRPGLSDADKVSIFEEQASAYRLLQQVLVAQKKTDAALEVSERGRARAFVELLATRGAAQPAAVTTTPPPTLKQMQQVAQQQNATLVEYSIIYPPALISEGVKEEWHPSALYIWVIQPSGAVAFRQVDLTSLKTPLQDLVVSSRESIGVRGRGSIGVVAKAGSSQIHRLQQLHQLLIQPIAELLPTDPEAHVVFIPQDELFLVPFAALQDKGGKYLVEQHTILTAPAIQVLELTQQQRQQVSGQGTLVVGDPTMPKLAGSLQPLQPLPGAAAEAVAIASLLQTQAMTGAQATEARVVQQMPQARMIHLATHGLLEDVNGTGVPGAIALAPGAQEDGLLTSSEILEMKLKAELVVLSACDTGRGRITGDGVIGLSRSLMSVGVPSVVVSLWAVPDAPTAALMTQFYQNLQGNQDKAQALRQAMLTTLKRHPNPRDWAAFTLIGEAE